MTLTGVVCNGYSQQHIDKMENEEHYIFALSD